MRIVKCTDLHHLFGCVDARACCWLCHIRPYKLYAESGSFMILTSSTIFSWLYRIRPSVQHSPFVRVRSTASANFLSSFGSLEPDPNQVRHHLLHKHVCCTKMNHRSTSLQVRMESLKPITHVLAHARAQDRTHKSYEQHFDLPFPSARVHVQCVTGEKLRCCVS